VPDPDVDPDAEPFVPPVALLVLDEPLMPLLLPVVPVLPVVALEPLSLEPVVPPLDMLELDPLDMPLALPDVPDLRAFSRAMQASRCDAGTLAQIAVASLARLAGTRSVAVPVDPDVAPVDGVAAVLPGVLPVPEVCAPATIAVPSAIAKASCCRVVFAISISSVPDFPGVRSPQQRNDDRVRDMGMSAR